MHKIKPCHKNMAYIPGLCHPYHENISDEHWKYFHSYKPEVIYRSMDPGLHDAFELNSRRIDTSMSACSSESNRSNETDDLSPRLCLHLLPTNDSHLKIKDDMVEKSAVPFFEPQSIDTRSRDISNRTDIHNLTHEVVSFVKALKETEIQRQTPTMLYHEMTPQFYLQCSNSNPKRYASPETYTLEKNGHCNHDELPGRLLEDSAFDGFEDSERFIDPYILQLCPRENESTTGISRSRDFVEHEHIYNMSLERLAEGRGINTDTDINNTSSGQTNVASPNVFDLCFTLHKSSDWSSIRKDSGYCSTASTQTTCVSTSPPDSSTPVDSPQRLVSRIEQKHAQGFKSCTLSVNDLLPGRILRTTLVKKTGVNNEHRTLEVTFLNSPFTQMYKHLDTLSYANRERGNFRTIWKVVRQQDRSSIFLKLDSSNETEDCPPDIFQFSVISRILPQGCFGRSKIALKKKKNTVQEQLDIERSQGGYCWRHFVTSFEYFKLIDYILGYQYDVAFNNKKTNNGTIGKDGKPIPAKKHQEMRVRSHAKIWFDGKAIKSSENLTQEEQDPVRREFVVGLFQQIKAYAKKRPISNDNNLCVMEFKYLKEAVEKELSFYSYQSL